METVFLWILSIHLYWYQTWFYLIIISHYIHPIILAVSVWYCYQEICDKDSFYFMHTVLWYPCRQRKPIKNISAKVAKCLKTLTFSLFHFINFLAHLSLHKFWESLFRESRINYFPVMPSRIFLQLIWFAELQ